jgi:hypothetical protein
MVPPAAEECLVQGRVGKYKGGTLIAEDVGELGVHQRRMADPDSYRPGGCARCQHARLHVHSYPERRLLADGGGAPVVRIVQYICADTECGATWRVVPLFLARHLWRTWRTVERVVRPVEPPDLAEATDSGRARDGPPVPGRTQRRWRGRFSSAARLLLVLLATSGSAALSAIAVSTGLGATRGELVAAHARAARATSAPGARLATLAALVHRLERGIRLM